jgi:hypothetical protein
MKAPEDEAADRGVRIVKFEPQGKHDGNGAEPGSGKKARRRAEDDTDREERDLQHRIIEAPALAYDPEPQRKWIVEDVIPDETLTLMTGEGGSARQRSPCNLPSPCG